MPKAKTKRVVVDEIADTSATGASKAKRTPSPAAQIDQFIGAIDADYRAGVAPEQGGELAAVTGRRQDQAPRTGLHR